jgi:hypothetical protein
VPRGFASAREAFAEIEARKNSGGGGGMYFKLPNNGDEAVVRFLDDEPTWAWVHDLPKDGGSYRYEVCRDQDPESGQRTGEQCPGCQKESETARQFGWKDRKYRRRMAGVINIIWRDAPVYEEDDNGRKNYEKVVGTADQAVKWTVGKTVLEELDGKAKTYKSLTSRDFKITRRGLKLDTTYDIEPVVDDEGNTSATPMSDADKEVAKEAPDLEGFFTIPTFEEWGNAKGGGDSGSSPPPDADVSPFTRKRQ